MNLDLKQQSTGNNDSVEEDLIAILNIKTEEARKTYREGMWAFGEMMLASLQKRLAEEKDHDATKRNEGCKLP